MRCSGWRSARQPSASTSVENSTLETAKPLFICAAFVWRTLLLRSYAPRVPELRSPRLFCSLRNSIATEEVDGRIPLTSTPSGVAGAKEIRHVSARSGNSITSAAETAGAPATRVVKRLYTRTHGIRR